MNRQEYIQEVREGIRLINEDWEDINQKLGIDVLDIVINLDDRFTKGEVAEKIVERCNETAKSQTEKLLNDPRIAIVDPEQEGDDVCTRCGGSGSILNIWDNIEDCPICKGTGRTKSNWLKVIPKEEYVKEV